MDMNHVHRVKKIVTLGPSTASRGHLEKLKDRGVDFVRVNLSHSSIDDLKYFIGLAKEVGLPFMIDTEGSQIRTGDLENRVLSFEEGDTLTLAAEAIKGTRSRLSLRPMNVIPQLRRGDILRLDFNTLILRIIDDPSGGDMVTAQVISGGTLGENKGVAVDTASGRPLLLPTLSPKDIEAIQIGLTEGIDHVLASFARSGKAVEEVRTITESTMKVISKIECIDGLENLDEIIEHSDAILIDRGDLSKEIPLERIPLTQKLIIHRAKKQNKEVIVATNLLETMVHEPKPTRAEAHDVINTIIDGATGLTLAAETAIGKHPIEAVSMLDTLIRHVEETIDVGAHAEKESALVEQLEQANYLMHHQQASLVSPHGGTLVNRIPRDIPAIEELDRLTAIELSEEQYMDLEQIAIGTFSPLNGFMSLEEVRSVLENMHLPSGDVWPLPIVLDVAENIAKPLTTGSVVALKYDGRAVGTLKLQQKFGFDKKFFASKLYGTLNPEHPGVQMVARMEPVLLSGPIELFHRRLSSTKHYELTPAQARILFETKGWNKVVGFHTRNVIHRSHEFIQMSALEQERCDGLFVHPVIGKKKKGDFHSRYIIESYEKMLTHFYPKERVVLGAFTTFSRYAGPREALFTALCRKNFGCSHFIVGRDHTGVGNFYHPHASHQIFDQFPDLGIKAVRFDEVFYSKEFGKHIHNKERPDHHEGDRWNISGTEARKMLERGEAPPEWFMRKEIAEHIIDAINQGENVFV